MMVYVFLCIIALLTLGAASSDNVQVGGSLENANRNSPYTIQAMFAAMSIITVVMTAAFANGAASRDFMYNTHQLLFTKPIRKSAYFFGRFSGAALVAMVPMLGVSIGILLAKHMPWVEAENWGPVSWSAHFWGMFALAIPNAIIVTALIFAVAAYTRSTITAFIAAILLIAGSAIASNLVADLDNRFVAALVDPFGSTAFENSTRYWTVAERNTQVLTLSGALLANRVLWLVVSMGILSLAYWKFTFTEKARRGKKTKEVAESTSVVALPPITVHNDWSARLAQLRSQIKVDFFETIKSNVFIVLLMVTLLNTSTALAFNATEGFGLASLPVTYKIVDLIRGTMYAFLLGIIAFYTGVLVWKERDAKLDEVYDALPSATWTTFVGKLTAMMLLIAIILSVGIGVGILAQMAHGYTRFQLGLYLTEILVLDLVSMFFLVLLSMLAHIFSPNKYIGYFAFVILVVVNQFAGSLLDISTRMIRYGSLPNYTYSDMFGYAPFVGGLWSFAVYWLLFAVLLGFASVLFWQRGRETQIRKRVSLAQQRLRGPTRIGFTLSLLAFCCMAVWVYYNTSVLNEFPSASTVRTRQASYETQFKQAHELAAQPHVTQVKYVIDIFPERRALQFVGDQTIVNRDDEPIDYLYLNFTPGLETEVDIENATLERDYPDLNYAVYRFEPPMAPEQELAMHYTVSYEPKGFEDSVSHQEIVQNGSFFNNTLAPQIGYQAARELTNRGDRKDQGLTEQQNLMPPLDPEDRVNRMRTYVAGANEWVDVETIISTTNEYAVAPGSLQHRWEEDGRNYFHYKLDHPSLNFYSFISADYRVAVNRWQDVDIEVYYHPDHEWNIENMLRSIRDSLAYYTEHFGPYRHKQARIIEFPRIADFAQAFPGTMPYSEGIGFIADISSHDDIDMVYYVVAHEMAHQWWAHQVVGANMQGATLLSETLAQYSALMVMEKQFGRDMMRKFLRYEMDSYLRSRGRELLKERPLLTVESSQGYIHYRKGSCVMYYLKEMIGEDKINEVLRGLVDRFGYQEPPYPTALDLVDGLREATPPELQYLIDDLFTEITLFANRVEDATYAELDDGRYKIRLDIICEKYRADEKGRETAIPVDDWIEIGAFAKPEGDGRFGKALYRERKKITQRESTFEFLVDQLPDKVGVDPFALLIDRVPDDNLKRPSRQ